LLVTSELIDAGASSFLTPRLDPCSPRGLLAPPHRARHDPQSCTVIRQVTPSSALMRGRKS
jgi:hypothetical protein